MPGMSRHRYSNARNSYLTSHVLQPGFGYTISIKDWETPTPSMENISERQSEPAAAPLYYSAASDLHNLTERLVARCASSGEFYMDYVGCGSMKGTS